MSSVSSTNTTNNNTNAAGGANNMGLYGSSPLVTGTVAANGASSSSSSSGGGGGGGGGSTFIGATNIHVGTSGLPALSSSASAGFLYPQHQPDSGPSSRSMSPLPSSASSTASAALPGLAAAPNIPSLIVGKRHRPSPSMESPAALSPHNVSPAPSSPSLTYSKQRQQQQQPQAMPGRLNGDARASPTAAPANTHSFQPKGLAVSRTAQFMAERKRRQEGGRLEDGRLGRRLEKLLAIHHNPVAPIDKSSKNFASGDQDEYDSTEEPLLAFASSTASTLRKASSELWATLRAASSQTSSAGGRTFPSLEAARARAAEDAARRAAEQSIVKWQEDAEARKCPICTTPFSLAVRKHHCRLCGRVVCASPHLTKPIFPNIPGAAAGEGQVDGLPLAQPSAAALAAVDPIKAATLLAEQKCSGLIVLTDARTGKVDDARKVAAEAAVGAASAAAAVSMSSEGGTGGGPSAAAASSSEVALKTIESQVEERAIRVCKDCRAVIFRQQYMLESGPTPTWLKLYETLMRLQREIEESLPEFHEMVLGLQKHDASTTLGSSARTTLKLQRDAAQARKQLLANFAAYDALAKRIRNLPTPASISRAAAAKMNAQGGTQQQQQGGVAKGAVEALLDDPQERVQLAIWTNANLFLQKNMFPLQTLPKPDASSSKKSSPSNGRTRSPSSNSLPTDNKASGNALSEHAAASAQIQEQVVVLREQQHLLEDYMARANAGRKFEDARMLRASWEEIEREVERLLASAAGGGSGGGGGSGAVRGEWLGAGGVGDPKRAAGGRR
ncbi:carboxypeptidase Y-deficient [Tilletia horrida]|nr:carboxypeptidase Y-deficient [Tilletia horrida]